jgi:hypothetical protein
MVMTTTTIATIATITTHPARHPHEHQLRGQSMTMTRKMTPLVKAMTYCLLTVLVGEAVGADYSQ